MKTNLITVPRSICWNITNQCNDHCSFCYRDTKSLPLCLEENKKILDKIAAEGVTKITFAGGEPLLYKGVDELIRYAKEKGMVVSLTTNGRFLTPERLETLAPYLDWLTMSLDAPDTDVQKAMTRAEDHFEVVTGVLAYIQAKKLPVKVKINTVVSAVNAHEVERMVPLLETYQVTRWKLFQFIPLRGAAETSADTFFISDKVFAKTVRKAEAKAAEHGVICISPTNSQDLESGYFTLFPNGDVRISTGMQDVTIGNLKYDSVAEIWAAGNYNKVSHVKRTNGALNNLETMAV